MYKEKTNHRRVGGVAVFFLLIAIIIIVRLFVLQITQHDYYALFAENTHEIYKQLHPTRGAIYWRDMRSKQVYPAAVNRTYYQIYAVPREIPPAEVVSTTNRLIDLLGITDTDKKTLLLTKLSTTQSKYAALTRKVPEDTLKLIEAEHLPGIYSVPEEYRFYPEEALGGPVVGFEGFDDGGNPVGRYGMEGYWEKDIAGSGGFVAGERGALGGWIDLAGRRLRPPVNGPDLFLTIDRTLEYQACQRLQKGFEDYKAKSGALVLMEATTGAVLAMCSVPDFNPNNYSAASSVAAYNNTTIFTPYEPGSVFKAITMAAGLDQNLVTPSTVYTDPCERVINGFRIRNAELKCYGQQTMTQVLEKSINTGAVWVQEKLGNDLFYDYVKKFGFGEKTGIELNTEVAGGISSLARKGQIFGANGSFGQGLTVTPLQLATAYAAIAHEGRLPKPYIVDEVQYSDGRRVRTEPQVAENVISPHAAKLLDGMLVSVVENHYHAAQIPHYYVAGKTGTAQVPEHGHYSNERTNHTFAGFAPADKARFVLVVKYEEPARRWAEETALPVFKDVMQFALQYANVPPER